MRSNRPTDSRMVALSPRERVGVRGNGIIEIQHVSIK
jgi:hypothetical protein